ncbi:hypothetical protein M5E89_12310 [Acidaminococcus intestini]|nr:hypothetical protein M5E89_12310 [Acidaminococcus intestini]
MAYLVDFIIKKAVFHDVPILIILLLNLTIFCAKRRAPAQEGIERAKYGA